MATNVLSPRPSFRFSGIWSRIRLGDDAATASAVRELVRQLAGTDDRHATGREKLRREILGAVTQAHQLGASEVYLAEQVADGIPVSAMLSVHRATPRISVAANTGAQAVMDAFVDGLQRTGHAEPDTERFAVGDSQVYRSVEVANGQPTKMLTVRFWVTIPGVTAVMPLTFATPFADLREPLTVLFTAVVATLRWSSVEVSH